MFVRCNAPFSITLFAETSNGFRMFVSDISIVVHRCSPMPGCRLHMIKSNGDHYQLDCEYNCNDANLDDAWT